MYSRVLPGWAEAYRRIRVVIACGPILLASVLLVGCRSVVQHPQAKKPNNPDVAKIHPAPGTSIVRFEQLDQGIYKGSKPKTEADYEFLQSLHVKYIVELRLFPLIHEGEKRTAKAHGMTLLFGTMNASPIAPSQKHVNQVLCLLRDKRYQPVYVHCDLGRDRATLIAGLYYLYYRGVSKQEAWEHMKNFGFKDDWSLRGLKTYFEQHSEPREKYVPTCEFTRATSSSCNGAGN